jgi:hypothetical protein
MGPWLVADLLMMDGARCAARQFCATGTMGLLRSLGADEILAQLHAAVAAVAASRMPPIRNVVFMGMVRARPLDLARVDTK